MAYFTPMPDADAQTQAVAGGYDAVYEALPRSATFARIWREHAMLPGYPEGFEHISFTTLDELRMIAAALRLTPRAVLVDLACGMAGPGLWIAREAAARLVGIDISAAALAGARDRAARLNLTGVATFQQGSFANTGLEAATAAGAMSLDALQYAPGKQAALVEIARILRPNARFVFACFEVDAARVAGVPVLGADPVGDYRPLLERAGFDVVSYEQTPRWHERVTAAYHNVIDAIDVLRQEMSEAACDALLAEMSLTLNIKPYTRRVLAVVGRRPT